MPRRCRLTGKRSSAAKPVADADRLDGGKSRLPAGHCCSCFTRFCIMLKRVKHGTAALRAFTFTKRGHLEKSLPHALEFDHFLLDFCQFRCSAPFHLLT